MPTTPAKSIRQISQLQPWLLLTSLLLVCILGTWGIDKTRINGPLYREIATAHILVGDILPPPLYIVEPYLSSVRLALAPPAASQPLQSRLAGEIALYREKKAEWQDARLTPEIRAELFERSLPAADRCIELIENELIPLVRQGRSADVAALLPRLEQAFLIHRESISRLADLGRRQAAAVETAAEQSIRQHLLLIAAALGLILGTTFLLSHRVSREISASVDTAVAAAEAVGHGQLKGAARHWSRRQPGNRPHPRSARKHAANSCPAGRYAGTQPRGAAPGQGRRRAGQPGQGRVPEHRVA